MAVTLSANLTEIEDCDVLTNWSSNETILVDTESMREGTGSIAIQKVSQETSYAQYDYYTDHGNAYLDITGETHIYFWTQCRQRLDTKANGGIRIRLTDASANYREWWVGGSDNYYGGFQNYVIYTGTAPNASSGTLNLAQIRYITFYWKVLSKTVVGANDCFVDIIYYGMGIIVGGGTSGDKGTFDQIITADETPAYGVLSKKFGVFMAQGPITFGDSAGATTTYFSDASQIVLFSDALVSSTHYAINIVGNATGTNSVQFGSVTGSGSSMVGSEGIVFKAINTSLPFSLNATNTGIDELKLYGSSFINASDVFLGSSTTLLGGSGTTVDLVDNDFSNPSQVFRNISGSATVTALRNSIVSANDSRASMDLYDGTATTSDEWTIIEGKGYEDSAGGATSITVTGEPFPNTATNKPYITVTNSAQVFNLDNVSNGSGGRITVTDQTEIAFDGETTNGDVNERFIVTWSVKTPGGTAIENARVKITESAPSAAIANQNNTLSSGAASSTYLRALYEPNGASGVTTTTHTPQAFKTYKYGYLPSVSSATIDQAVTNTVAMLTDSFQVETTAATAITLGDTTRNVQIIDDRTATDYILILKYTAGSNTLTAGQTILSSGSGTWRGVVKEIIEGNSTAGTIVVEYSSGVVFSDSAGTLDNTPSSGTWTATYTTSSVLRFAMGINADTLTPQQLYDYVNAKLEAATLDTTKNFDDMVIWGKSAEGIPIQGVGSKFKTVRNDSTTQQGWVIWNLGGTGLDSIASYMANDSSLFTPASTVTLEINGVKTTTEPTNYVRVRIEADSGGPLAVGTTIMNTQATTSYGSSGFYKTTASFTYTSDQPVIIKARYIGYIPFETTGTITSSGLTVTAVWLVDSNFTP